MGDVDRAAWDDVVDSSRASIFYRSAVLAAYEQFPLQEIETALYLTAFDPTTGRLEAVLPLYLLPWTDPLGVLSQVTGPLTGSRMLLSHVWHWYDTSLPARRLDGAVVEAFLHAISRLAEESGAACAALVNVPGRNGLVTLLTQAGAKGVEAERRFVLDLCGLRSLEAYLGSLRKSARRNLRVYARRAEEAGVECRVEAPPLGAADDVVELCRRAAAKHGNDDWYGHDSLAGFLHACGPAVRLVRVRRGDETLAASICFVDGHRLHTWAGGADYSSGERFSPNYLLFHEEVRLALESGCRIFEGGRRNDAFKLRHGLQPLPLFACALPIGRQP
jgi:predicted N-acyltransferase